VGHKQNPPSWCAVRQISPAPMSRAVRTHWSVERLLGLNALAGRQWPPIPEGKARHGGQSAPSATARGCHPGTGNAALWDDGQASCGGSAQSCSTSFPVATLPKVVTLKCMNCVKPMSTATRAKQHDSTTRPGVSAGEAALRQRWRPGTDMSRVRVRYPLYSCCRGVGTVDSAAEVAARRPEKTAQRKRAMVMVVSTGSEVRTRPATSLLTLFAPIDARTFVHRIMNSSGLVLSYDMLYIPRVFHLQLCAHTRAPAAAATSTRAATDTLLPAS
jgi:hypothetical protein